MQGNTLKLALGYSHDVEFPEARRRDRHLPQADRDRGRRGDQQLVGQVAANIREWRPPEPYKGKGIRYKDEYIFRKEGKKK
jgi:large subunit ribosomal protein L6